MACLYDGMSLQNGRSVNVDSLLLKERTIDGCCVCFAVVCDGVGSLRDGAFAASTAVRLLSSWFDGLNEIRRLGLLLRDAVGQADRTIAALAEAQGFRTAATLSALVTDQERYYIVHTGDSRIYGWWNGELEQLTRDQVVGGKLTSCIGRPAEAVLCYNKGLCRSGTFLLCSDGLYKRMDREFLLNELSHLSPRSLRRTMERLTDHVIGRGETDNISVALMMSKK